ncbi:MAG: hypothetical protein EAZ27_09830 [Cytophagales bacterium]|nr:MAG: hypothetical protein EAZ27_09830 [Cytophagales bacterium]
MSFNSDRQIEISKKLRIYYILALLSVAIFSIIGQIVVQYAISKQKSEATVINLAGRQRMLSQRICKNVLMISPQNKFMQDSISAYRKDLLEIIPIWENVHLGLKSENLQSNGASINVINSEKINEMFKEIDPIFLNILKASKDIVLLNENSNIETLNFKTNIILQNERKFLSNMDRIVFQYDKEAKEQMAHLKNIEFILFIITILILFLEGIFIFKPLHHQVTQIISGLFESEKNLFHLNTKLNSTNDSLIKTQKELVQTTEDKFKLQLHEGKVRSASLIEGQEDERKRIAFELHDGLGQMLTGLKLTSERIPENELGSEKNINTMKELKQFINETIEETRTISFNLAPSVLNDFGIFSALKILLENSTKNTNIKYNLIFQEIEKRFISNIEISLYRIAQESINNIQKHANASIIEIEIKFDSNFVHLIITDDGNGFDLKKKKSQSLKNGIRNMKSRAEVNQGDFKISSIVGKGTKIVVKLPLK